MSLSVVDFSQGKSNVSSFEHLESNVQSYANNFPDVFEFAEGAEIWADSGMRYLDFLSGAGSLNYGHNPPELKSELLKYIENNNISNSLDLHTRAKRTFLDTLDEVVLQPRGLDHVVQFTGPTGANAVEAAMKLARRVTGRSTIAAFTNGFHGVTTGALSATGNTYNRGASGLPLTGVFRLPYDGYLGEDTNTIDYFEKLLEDPSSGLDLPAAVIFESVQGEGGHNVASDSWLQQLQALCRKHQILLIADEVQAGCGRTGEFFGFDNSGILPDIITVSKSISGYGLPLALCLIKREFDAWLPGEHNGTFRGNNLAFVTATAALKKFWKSGKFEGEIFQRSDLLRQRLSKISELHCDAVTEVRGKGMMMGLAFGDPELARRVTAHAFQLGLIAERVGPHDELVKIMAPINIRLDHLNEGLDILETSIAEVTSTSPHSKFAD
ncbi:MAG: diaminobutyrate--2-oxoglutarate transaminase [Rhizobiaceae bacterium]